MLKHFTYTKKSGEKTNRVIYPLRLIDGDKILAIDLTDYNDKEREDYTNLLDKIHREYLDNIYEAGFASNFRSFFVENMS